MSSKTIEAQEEHQTLNFLDLEKEVNSLTLELHQAEKLFTQQAKKINNIDKVLFDNRGQLLIVYDAIEQLKTQQQIVDEHLEFLANQLKIFTQSLELLQVLLDIKSEIDLERQHLYSMVENLNAQLKQTSANLKDIIEDLNKVANEAEAETGPSPMAQISKIFDIHIDSLERIEDAMQKMQNKLTEIENLQANIKDSL